jgi:uncharacterized protein involved in type VI secretion and phage assembly
MVRARLQIGDASVLVHRARIDEQLSGLVSAAIELGQAPGDPAGWVGASARLVLVGRGHRRFCGIVRAVETGASTRLRLRIEPGFATLADEVLTRPFVRVSTPDLLRALLGPALHELDGRELALHVPVDPGRFPVRDLCVQYGESTYDFCRRLMADAGLVHHFDHDERAEKMVITDGGPVEAERDVAPLPAFKLARARFQRAGQPAEILRGRSRALLIEPGRRFRVADRTVLVTAARHQLERGRYTSDFTCVPARVGFRPAPIARPLALEDWAVVVAPSATDGISDDPDGRVQVRFIYDRREGSPLIAVGQGWAGPGHGVEVLPRAGMLVRIEYLRGDPDQPIVAGCLPTVENTGPAPLPARASRLAIRTRSLRPGDAGAHAWNEIALGDDAGGEELLVRAGRDLRREVVRDQRVAIDRDEGRLVGNDQALQVTGSRRAAIARSDAASTGGAASARVGRSRKVTVKGQDSATYRGGRAREVTGRALLAVTQRLKLAADKALVAQQGKASLELADDGARLASANQLHLENAEAQLSLRSAGQATFTAPTIQLVCGASRVVLGPESVVLEAARISVHAPAAQLELDGRGAATTGTTVTSSATMVNVLHGLPVIFSDAGSKS